MQENEFEKQVRSKMDAFRLRPSDPVWLNIRVELRKKRRRGLLFIPLLAMLLVAGFYGWKHYFRPAENTISAHINETSKDHNADNNKSDKSSPVNDANAMTSKNEKPQPGQGIKQLPTNEKEIVVRRTGSTVTGSNKEYNTDPKTITSGAGDTKSETNGIVALRHPGANRPLKKMVNAYIEHKNDKPGNPRQVNTVVHVSNERPGGSGREVLPAGEIFATGAVYADHNPVYIDHSITNIHLLPDSITDRTISDVHLPAFNKTNASTATGNLKLGFVFSTGFSTRQEKLFQLNSGPAEGKSPTANAPYALSSFANAGRGVLILQPSPVKAGLAFTAGVIAMKPVSKRFDVSAGLQYSYSSDHIEIGSPVNSYIAQIDVQAAAFNAATNGSTTKKMDYTNRYHYIELPVSVYFNITPKWKIPLVWNAGFLVSRLVSTNVLIYDGVLGGVYYEGRKDVNKTQLALSTGFAFRFGSTNHMQWSIGPEFNLNTSKLFQNNYDKNTYPVYGGLNVQVLFPAGKKKRSHFF